LAEGAIMKRILVGAIVAMAASASSPAVAQERAGDAALGALSGAVVLGPVGAVAGAIVGFTAGPSIARSWGLRGERARPARRSVKARAAPTTPARATSGTAASAQARQSTPPATTPSRGPSTPPPQTLE
jgi:hypothetical protein